MWMSERAPPPRCTSEQSDKERNFPKSSPVFPSAGAENLPNVIDWRPRGKAVGGPGRTRHARNGPEIGRDFQRLVIARFGLRGSLMVVSRHCHRTGSAEG